MKAWTDSTFTSSLALRLGLGLAVLGALGCDSATAPPGGASAPVPPVEHPTCTTLAIDGAAVFQPTAGPDLARFRLVAATDTVVFASAGTSLHRSLDEGKTWSLVDAPELRGATVLALASFGTEIFVSVQVEAGPGIFRSTDGGATWTSASTDACSMASYLTSDGKSLFASSGNAVYEWDAAMATWHPLAAPPGLGFDVIESNGAYIYANSMYTAGVYQLELGVPDAAWTQVVGLPEWGYAAFAFDGVRGFAASPTGFFQSTDAGASWQPVENAMPEVEDLLVAGGAVFAATSEGLRISTDGGATWDAIGDQPSDTFFSLASTGSHVFSATDALRRASSDDLAAGGWQEVHVAGDKIDMLHAVGKALLSVSEGLLLRSTDGGGTWTEVTIDGGAASLTHVVVRSGSTGDTVFGLRQSMDGDVAVMASMDDGATFQEQGLIPGESPWVGFLSVTNGGLVAGVSTGAGIQCTDVQDVTTTLYRSSDDGVTWAEDMNGFPITFTDCYDESFTPGVTGVAEAGGVLFATTFWAGSYRSVDGGGTWTAIETPEAIGAISSVTDVDGALVGIAAGGGLARSKDGGVTWEPSGLGGLLVASLLRADPLLLASVPSSDPKQAGIYASSDGGGTWSRVDASFDARVASVAVQGGRLFAGTLDESVWAAPLGCTSK